MNSADVAGARDRDPHQSPPPDSMCACSSSSASMSETKTSTSPSWPTRSAVTTCALPKRRHRGEPEPAGPVELGQLLADRLGRDRPLDEPDPARRVDPVVAGLAGQQPAEHLIGRPRDGRDRRDAEALVDQRPARVVDAGDDVLDAVGLARDAGAQDVGVVAVRHRGESTGLRRSRPAARWSRSNPKPTTVLPREVRRRGGGTRARSCRRRRRVCPPCSSAPASSLPTRPHPMTTTCTTGPPSAERRRADATAVDRRTGVKPGTAYAAPREWHAGAATTTGLDGTNTCSTASSGCSWAARWRPPSRNTNGSQDDRARGVLLRRDLVDRVRDRRDPASSSRSRPSSLALGLSKLVPIAIVVAMLLAIVVTSYRQTIFAYPSGGGSYIVSRENLGETPSLDRGRVAARRLHPHGRGVDLAPASPRSCRSRNSTARSHYRVVLCLAILVLITVANLRGIKESGRMFAFPTYVYIVMLVALVVPRARRKIATSAGSAASSPVPYRPGEGVTEPGAQTGGTLGLFQLLKGFSSGAVALTGVEAISNGVPAFRRPESQQRGDHAGLDGDDPRHAVPRRVGPGPPPAPVPEPSEVTVFAADGPARCSATTSCSGSSSCATAGDPHAGGEHRVRRLPAAVVDHRPRRLPAAPTRQPGRPAGVLATACSCSRSSRAC